MSSRTLWFKVLSALIQAVLLFNPHNVKADFSDSCVNSTTSTSCIHTYEQLYNTLAKSQNSFNIESALYPAKRPSSVLVRVSVCGLTNIQSCAKYLWSISCLYAAIPATVLEISSLGSILVASRTQNLTIQIPPFCRNVSDNDTDRGTIIEGMIEDVLAAVSASEFRFVVCMTPARLISLVPRCLAFDKLIGDTKKIFSGYIKIWTFKQHK